MIIGNIIINRSSKLKRVLMKTDSSTGLWQRVFGIYSARIFGVCVYRTTRKLGKDLQKILDGNSGLKGN